MDWLAEASPPLMRLCPSDVTPGVTILSCIREQTGSNLVWTYRQSLQANFGMLLTASFVLFNSSIRDHPNIRHYVV